MQHLVAPSLLSADFSNLGKEIKMLNQSQADWIHLDVMDGVFVPNITFGPPLIRSIRNLTEKIFDVHLMIIEPEKYFRDFQKAGADILSIHYEVCPHLHRSVQQIKNSGMKAGVVLNPHTPINVLEDIISDLDLVLIMSVNPGFGGQKFIGNTFQKISKLKDLILQKNVNTLIEVDGGIGLQNCKQLIEAGTDVLVAGSSIFSSNKPIETINNLKNFSCKI